MQQRDNLLDVAYQAFKNHPTFGDLLLAEEKQHLLDHGVVRSVQAGEVLCQQNQLDTRVFILVIGEMEVNQGEGDNRIILSTLRRGSLFGEIAALFKTPRVSNVVANKPSVLLEIPGEIFEKVISDRNELLDAVIELYKQRVTETAIYSVPAFSSLDKNMIKRLIAESSLLSIGAGGVLMKEEEPGDAMYVIIHGMARVSHRVGDHDVNLALLRAGDYAGEWSLMTGKPRAATVSAVTRLDVVRIDCRLFLEFVEGNPEIHNKLDMNRLDRVAHHRYKALEEDVVIPESLEQVRTVVSEIENIMDGK